MTDVAIITQARMTSTRLPGKVLLPAAGRTMLTHHLARLGAAGFRVILGTTVNASDDAVASEAQDFGVAVFRGDEHDVLSRFAGAVEAFPAEVLVRVTSDCPLIDADLIRRGVDEFLALDDDYAFVSNTLRRTYPRGFDFEVFSAAALREAAAEATTPAEREHVTPYMYAGTPPRAALHAIVGERDSSTYRLTLDTPEDYTLLRTLIEDHGAARLSAYEIIALLDAHPELVAINAHVEQKKLGA